MIPRSSDFARSSNCYLNRATRRLSSRSNVHWPCQKRQGLFFARTVPCRAGAVPTPLHLDATANSISARLLAERSRQHGWSPQSRRCRRGNDRHGTDHGLEQNRGSGRVDHPGNGNPGRDGAARDRYLMRSGPDMILTIEAIVLPARWSSAPLPGSSAWNWPHRPRDIVFRGRCCPGARHPVRGVVRDPRGLDAIRSGTNA